jgi:DMSO/TMAO reductase YedYZ molybdopterin-dependent catalytic subunit
VEYTGVALKDLLEQAGYDPAVVNAVQAIASDGYSVKYGQDLAMLDNTLVAYAQADGPLSADDGTFRMVLPDQEGKMNVRMLAEIHVNP